MGILRQRYMVNIVFEREKKAEIRHDVTQARIILCRWCIVEKLRYKKLNSLRILKLSDYTSSVG